VIEAVLHDPLVFTLVLLVLGVVASRVLFRRFPLGRAIIRVVFLVMLTVALLYAGIVPYQPLQPTGIPVRDVVHGVLKIAWWLWAAWFLVGFIRAFIYVEQRPHEARLVQDLLAGLAYLTALFAIVAYVLDLPIQGLLATSGVIAIILGLALQSTLGDVFSGIVLSFSRPYRPGDWVNIDGGTEGRVIEINWRATHILTGRRDLAVLPNSTIAKSKIVNVSSPSRIRGTTITVAIDSRSLPALAAEVLEQALINCSTILTAPAPSVVISAISGSATEFGVTFFVADHSAVGETQSELMGHIYRHLAAAGVGLAAAPNTALLPEETRTRPERVIDLTGVFTSLPTSERTALAARARPCSHKEGDTLLVPGAALRSLFIIGGGVLSYLRDNGEYEEELMRLGPGDHYGEIGLLTGAVGMVRITALTPMLVYELAAEELSGILKTYPETSQALDRRRARREAVIMPPESTATEEAILPPQRLRSRFTEWLHRRYAPTASE
jgi:small-conductance mechanosensitive channel/CRP-like cAMP-binding protein